MKALKVNFWLCLICLAMGCKTDRKSEYETISFKANFITLLASMEENEQCSSPMNMLNTQEGNGTATLLGEFTTRITFCIDTSTLKYGNGQGSFIGKNGEVISFIGSGQVLASEEPGYDFEFQDRFAIVGGSGRFEGATGSLTSNSFVNMATHQTDHVWSGKIKIKRPLTPSASN